MSVNEKKHRRMTKSEIISADPVLVNERLKGWERIPKNEYRWVRPGTWIQYLKFVEGQNDGMPLYRFPVRVIGNQYPEKWTIQRRLGKRWITSSVSMDDRHIFFQKKKPEFTEYQLKDIYDALHSGKFRLVRTRVLKKLLLNQSGGSGVAVCDECGKNMRGVSTVSRGMSVLVDLQGIDDKPDDNPDVKRKDEASSIDSLLLKDDDSSFESDSE